MVVANWNLYRGGNTLALNEEFVERLAEAHEVLGQARRAAEEDARLSWAALKTARERKLALNAQVVANERVRDAYIQQFNIGQRSLLDVLDAENELFVSRGDLLTAEFVEIFAGYRLMATAGTLLDNLAVSRPAEALVAGYDPELAAEPPQEYAGEETPAEAEEVQPEMVYEEGAEPAVVVDETVLEEETVATEETTGVEEEEVVEAKPEVPDAPTEGFKEAEGEVSDDTLLSLNFNPLWSLE
jgi:adhesin transport system outer membrane protein